MSNKIENMKIVIPAAGNGTRGYPATTAFSKELIPLPFDGFLQNIICIQIEKLLEIGVLAKNIAIVISPEKNDIRQVFEIKQELVDSLRKKGKDKFAEKIERLGFLSPKNFILQNCVAYGNQAPLSTPEVIEFIGKDDFWYVLPDDIFAIKNGKKNEFLQMFETYQKFNGSVMAAKEVLNDAEFDKYGIVAGLIVAREKGSNGNLIVDVERIDEKPGVENAKSNLASVCAWIFKNNYLESLAWNLTEWQKNPNGELMLQSAIQHSIDNGEKFYAVQIRDGWYCDSGNSFDYSLSVPAMMLAEDESGEYLEELRRIVNFFEK